MQQEVRYCTTEDGVRIAFSAQGDGPPLLICSLFVESFSLDEVLPSRKQFMERLGEGRRLIQYDMRGTGLSQRDAADMSNEAMVRDMAAVVEAAAPGEPISIFAITVGATRAIAYAAENADRVKNLVLVHGFARPLDFLTMDALQGFAGLARGNWQIAAQTFADLGNARTDAPEEGTRGAAAFLESTDGETAARFMLTNAELDLSPLLPKVRARSLVIHRANSTFVPLRVGQALAAQIADARLVTPPGRMNAPWSPQAMPETVLDPAIAFLDEDPETRSRPSSRERPEAMPVAVRTILFTDLAGHSEMMSRLGDVRGREVLREHERIIREVLRQHGGTEVKALGDGFMASFGSVTRAVECAIALQRAMEERNQQTSEPANQLLVRVGLNAGEPIEDEGDLFGATVILASRIAAKAEGGEILVADTVRGLCAGKGFLFSDRGEFVAKGFEEPVRVYEVRWRE